MSRRFSIHTDLMLFFRALALARLLWCGKWQIGEICGVLLFRFMLISRELRLIWICFKQLLHVFLAAQLALYLPPLPINSQCCVADQRDRRGNAHNSGHISCNFLKQASWRLYEIRQPLICLCTTSNFFSNTTIETLHVFKHVIWGQL